MNKPTVAEQKPNDKVTTPPSIEKKEPLIPATPSPSSQPTVETGINLIPTLSGEEIKQENKKKKLNVGSIVSLLVLVVVTILVVGFNIISKMAVNAEAVKLKEQETSVTALSQIMLSSNEITERAQLYESIQSENYSPKTVIEYLNNIAKKSGNSTTITVFTLGNDLTFTITGEALSLEDVSKFWYLLSNDSKVEEVTLSSVGNSANYARFTFEGSLVVNEFLNSTE